MQVGDKMKDLIKQLLFGVKDCNCTAPKDGKKYHYKKCASWENAWKKGDFKRLCKKGC